MRTNRWALEVVTSVARVSVLCALFTPLGWNGILAAALFPNPVFDVGGSPASIAIGDFNGDGVEDLAVANFNTYDVSVLIGLGDGTYEPEMRFAAGLSPIVIAVGDFDGNGRQDLAVSNSGSDAVSVLMGLGDGTFAPQAFFAVGDFPGSMVVGDFDRDGHEDLAVANFGSHDVSVLMGLGDGRFAPQTSVLTGDYPTSLVTGDFNGDGRLDLVVVSPGSSNVSVMQGVGDGTFGVPIIHGFINSRTRQDGFPLNVAAGDFNGDGILDLAVGTGFWLEPGHTTCACETITITDVKVLLGLGDGAFTRAESLAVPDPRGMIVGDLNADGLADLVVARSAGVTVVPSLGDGTFGLPAFLVTRGIPAAVAIGQLDGDAHQDLAVPYGAGEVAVFKGLGDGRFGPQMRFGVGNAPESVAICDLDADGRQDLAVANAGSDDVSVAMGQGDGTFGPHVRFAAGDFPWSVGSGDFNADGVVDLAVANQGSDDVSVLMGRGEGIFDPQVRYAAGRSPWSILVGDLNGDGNTDLAVVNALSYDVSVLLGLGDGTFSLQTRFAVGQEPRSVVAGDFDGDGNQDLAVSNASSYDISVLLGLGDGTFAPERRIPSPPSSSCVFPVSIAAGDFNADGSQDLAVGHGFDPLITPECTTVGGTYGIGDVSLLLGRGDGTFEPQALVSLGFRGEELAVDDFNADGHPDLSAAGSDGLAVMLGSGDGTFAPRMEFLPGGGPTSLAAGDLDADGFPDLAVTNANCGSCNYVSVLLNQSVPPNRPPVATAGPDAQIECSSPAGATIVLDGSASSDPDSAAGTDEDIVAFDWFEAFGQPAESLLGSGHTLAVTLPLGTHAITLRVTDRAGLTGMDELLVTVLDSTPPTIALAAAPLMLWPPNHRMVEIGATVSASDACGGAAVSLASIMSSEPDDAPGMGDGATVGDIQGATMGTADFAFSLRAERAATGPGRVYSITYQATDGSGHVSPASAEVVVPHDRDGVTDPLVLGVEQSTAGTILRWDEVPGALFYSAIRGDVRSLLDQNGTFQLGPVGCVGSAITGTSTEGVEDPEVPSPGESFFYLVEYHDGRASGYGTESAARETVVSTGPGCP